MFLLRSGACNNPQNLYGLLEKQLKEAGNVTRYREIFGESFDSENMGDDGIEMGSYNETHKSEYSYATFEFEFEFS